MNEPSLFMLPHLHISTRGLAQVHHKCNNQNGPTKCNLSFDRFLSKNDIFSTFL